jgi:hypothetical protein
MCSLSQFLPRDSELVQCCGAKKLRLKLQKQKLQEEQCYKLRRLLANAKRPWSYFSAVQSHEREHVADTAHKRELVLFVAKYCKTRNVRWVKSSVTAQCRHIRLVLNSVVLGLKFSPWVVR